MGYIWLLNTISLLVISFSAQSGCLPHVQHFGIKGLDLN
jgi:hypothetical protein